MKHITVRAVCRRCVKRFSVEILPGGGLMGRRCPWCGKANKVVLATSRQGRAVSGIMGEPRRKPPKIYLDKTTEADRMFAGSLVALARKLQDARRDKGLPYRTVGTLVALAARQVTHEHLD